LVRAACFALLGAVPVLPPKLWAPPNWGFVFGLTLCHRRVCLRPADMDNYNELVKLVHGSQQALFF
jgi:hypothetical protein